MTHFNLGFVRFEPDESLCSCLTEVNFYRVEKEDKNKI